MGPPSAPLDAGQPAVKAPRILVVEDERIVAMGLRKQLQNLGYQALAPVASREAAVARAGILRPDLVLMDICLEGQMDGLEAAAEIRQRFRLPVVYLTAYSNKDILDRAKATEPFGYILKPFADRDLQVVIETALYKHQMERRLQERERWFAATLKSIGDAVIATDDAGDITFMNAMAERLTGWTNAQAQGKPLEGVAPLHAETHQAVEAPVRQALLEGVTQPLADDVLLAARDGTHRPVDVSASPITDDAGAPLGGVMVFRDVTERRRWQEALREADRRKDEFLATLAHELRNLLAPVGSATRILQRHGPASPSLQRAEDVIERQIRQMTRLVEDLLDISRIGRGKVEIRKEVVDLGTIVTHAVGTARPLLEGRRHELTVALPPGPLWLEADPARLEQVLTNLLNNACKYTEPQGRIGLSALREGEDIVIRVRDTGIGIPGEILPRVFDLFTQADGSRERSPGGLGIGLALVRGLVEMHGGSVEALSDGPGRGSEFVVRLPGLAQAPPEPGKVVPPLAVKSAGSPVRVLLVDDNVPAAEMLADLLRLDGHEVRAVFDGRAALEAARSYQPKVVLLDIGMAGMDGYEVARRLRQQPGFESVLLVALTGWAQDTDRRRCLEAGFDRHLVKPVDLDALQQLLASPDLRAEPARRS